MASKPNLPSIDLNSFYNRIREALAVHLLSEARRFGLSFSMQQIGQLCDSLLSEPNNPTIETKTSFYSQRVLHENSLLDSYYTENLEIQDYLYLISQEMRKALGQFQTPSVIVKHILNSTGYRVDSGIINKRFIDPACGSGIFLIEAVRIFLAALRREGIPIRSWYQKVLTAFVGIDIDPIACLYTRFNLCLLLTPSILIKADSETDFTLPPLPVFCFDTLKAVSSEIAPRSLFSDETAPLPLTNKFDFVIGNPPYYKIGRLSQELKTAFQASLYGHPNAYGLFIHAGIEMLRTGGALGFIVPRSMLSGLYFQNLRQFIEQRTEIKEVTLIADRKRVFENVLQGTMILAVRRRSKEKKIDDESHEIKTAIVRSITYLDDQQNSGIRVFQDRVIRQLNGTKIWFVADNNQTYQILDIILRSNPLLSDPRVDCQAKTGPIVWNRVKTLLRDKPSHDTLPLIWATDISRFSFSFGSLEGMRPANLQMTPKTCELVTKGMSILVQRVTADEQSHRLVACIPEEFCSQHKEGYFVENHMNVIQPGLNAPPTDLYFILGLINSEVLEFFFRSMNGNTQVSATELNLMPIPLGKWETEIADLAHRLQKTSELNLKTSLETELNKVVAQAYGLSLDNLAFIHESLVRNHDN